MFRYLLLSLFVAYVGAASLRAKRQTLPPIPSGVAAPSNPFAGLPTEGGASVSAPSSGSASSLSGNLPWEPFRRGGLPTGNDPALFPDVPSGQRPSFGGNRVDDGSGTFPPVPKPLRIRDGQFPPIPGSGDFPDLPGILTPRDDSFLTQEFPFVVAERPGSGDFPENFDLLPSVPGSPDSPDEFAEALEPLPDFPSNGPIGQRDFGDLN